MGFNNGYDSGYADALEDVRNGRVAGLGPASGGGGAAPAPAFNAGVLEGYDVEKLLSTDDLSTYLATLSDTDIKALLDADSTSSLATMWDSVRNNMPSSAAKLAGVLAAVLDAANTRGLIYNDE